jgi:hypothetical protein
VAKSSPRAPRKPGGGGPRIDWGAARTYFLSDPGVTYRDVSERFDVSTVSVGKHARAESWQRTRAEIESKAARGAEVRVARTREERNAKVLEIVNLVVDHVFEDLTPAENGTPKVRAELARVPEFVKLAELLEGKPSDHVTYEEQLSGLRVVLGIAARYVPKGKRAEFLAEVNEALGASE